MVKLNIRIDEIFDTGMNILDALDRGQLLENYQLICNRLSELLKWHYAEVWIYDDASREMILSDIHYAKNELVEHFSRVRLSTRFSFGKGIPGEVWESREPLWIDNVTTYQSFKRKEAAKTMKFKTCFAIPISAYDHVEAVIVFYSKSSYEPDPIILRLIHLIAKRIGLNLIKLELEKDLQSIHVKSDQFTELISRISSIRDPYTSKHESLVRNLATYIADKMKMTKSEIEDIQLAALLHDIGKIAIPMEILSKPSKLNKEEFALIKTHVEVGYSIVENLTISESVKRMILEHHERLDGSGYPNQLKNKEIYIGSQVISIADVTSAMLENRPYRVAHKIETVKEELIQNAGIKYNPIMVDIVIDLMDQQPEFFYAKA